MKELSTAKKTHHQVAINKLIITINQKEVLLMKTITGQLKFILILMLTASSVLAQIPNEGFEQWNGNNPVNWVTSNVESFIFVTPSSNPLSGSFAARLETKEFSGVLGQAILSAGPDGEGFAVNQRHGQLSLYYKFHKTIPTAFLTISVGFKKGEDGIGAGVLSINNAADQYTPVTIPVTYFTNDIPDLAVITIIVNDQFMNPAASGSYAEIDNLSFEQLTDVNGENTGVIEYELDQNFPNPFNPSTTIRFSIPESGNTTIKVYNVLGSEVATLLNEVRLAGTYEVAFNALDLPSGAYFYSIEVNDFRDVKKMILMK